MIYKRAEISSCRLTTQRNKAPCPRSPRGDSSSGSRRALPGFPARPRPSCACRPHIRWPARPIAVGKIHLDFYVKSKLESTPLTEIPGLPAPLAVSSPEATALDLIAFSHRLGGIERALEVIQGLEDAMTGTGMRSALRSGVPGTLPQRIGYAFPKLQFDSAPAVVR